MMRDEVAPRLRALGFKGSGQRFTLPSETHWAFVGFQRSAWSDRTALRFTINLTVVSKEEWKRARADHSYLGERPQANAAAGGPAWDERIGFLMPERRDHWWSMGAGEPSEGVAAGVIDAVERFALPELLRQIAGSPDARPSIWANSGRLVPNAP